MMLKWGSEQRLGVEIRRSVWCEIERLKFSGIDPEMGEPLLIKDEGI
jgi:hypothetical protein